MELKEITYYANARVEMLRFIPSSAKKILEFGCGQGNFSAQLIKDGVETWGVEPDPLSYQEASQKNYIRF